MKGNIAEEITNRILEDLEKGVMPWEKPWKQGRGLPLPVNAGTKKFYRGINIFLLWKEAQKRGFSTSSWMTFKQAQELKGHVRQGERGTNVIFYKRLTKARKLDLEDEVVLDEHVFCVLRTYTVFNLDQVEGLEHLRPKAEAKEPLQSIQEAEAVLATSGAKIIHSNVNEAFFNRDSDQIVLPFKEDFKSPESYYGTALHELTHWTGHPSRLNREFGKRFGDQAYAFEEMVAELGAAFLCASVGIPYDTRHASYIDHWIQILKEHKRAIFTATAKAQAAMDFVLKTEFVEAAA